MCDALFEDYIHIYMHACIEKKMSIVTLFPPSLGDLILWCRGGEVFSPLMSHSYMCYRSGQVYSNGTAPALYRSTYSM